MENRTRPFRGVSDSSLQPLSSDYNNTIIYARGQPASRDSWTANEAIHTYADYGRERPGDPPAWAPPRGADVTQHRGFSHVPDMPVRVEEAKYWPGSHPVRFQRMALGPGSVSDTGAGVPWTPPVTGPPRGAFFAPTGPHRSQQPAQGPYHAPHHPLASHFHAAAVAPSGDEDRRARELFRAALNHVAASGLLPLPNASRLSDVMELLDPWWAQERARFKPFTRLLRKFTADVSAHGLQLVNEGFGDGFALIFSEDNPLRHAQQPQGGSGGAGGQVGGQGASPGPATATKGAPSEEAQAAPPAAVAAPAVDHNAAAAGASASAGAAGSTASATAVTSGGATPATPALLREHPGAIPQLALPVRVVARRPKVPSDPSTRHDDPDDPDSLGVTDPEEARLRALQLQAVTIEYEISLSELLSDGGWRKLSEIGDPRRGRPLPGCLRTSLKEFIAARPAMFDLVRWDPVGPNWYARLRLGQGDHAPPPPLPDGGLNVNMAEPFASHGGAVGLRHWAVGAGEPRGVAPGVAADLLMETARMEAAVAQQQMRLQVLQQQRIHQLQQQQQQQQHNGPGSHQHAQLLAAAASLYPSLPFGVPPVSGGGTAGWHPQHPQHMQQQRAPGVMGAAGPLPSVPGAAAQAWPPPRAGGPGHQQPQFQSAPFWDNLPVAMPLQPPPPSAAPPQHAQQRLQSEGGRLPTAEVVETAHPLHPPHPPHGPPGQPGYPGPPEAPALPDGWPPKTRPGFIRRVEDPFDGAGEPPAGGANPQQASFHPPLPPLSRDFRAKLSSGSGSDTGAALPAALLAASYLAAPGFAFQGSPLRTSSTGPSADTGASSAAASALRMSALQQQQQQQLFQQQQLEHQQQRFEHQQQQLELQRLQHQQQHQQRLQQADDADDASGGSVAASGLVQDSGDSVDSLDDLFADGSWPLHADDLMPTPHAGGRGPPPLLQRQKSRSEGARSPGGPDSPDFLASLRAGLHPFRPVSLGAAEGDRELRRGRLSDSIAGPFSGHLAAAAAGGGLRSGASDADVSEGGSEWSSQSLFSSDRQQPPPHLQRLWGSLPEQPFGGAAARIAPPPGLAPPPGFSHAAPSAASAHLAARDEASSKSADSGVLSPGQLADLVASLSEEHLARLRAFSPTETFRAGWCGYHKEGRCSNGDLCLYAHSRADKKKFGAEALAAAESFALLLARLGLADPGSPAAVSAGVAPA